MDSKEALGRLETFKRLDKSWISTEAIGVAEELLANLWVAIRGDGAISITLGHDEHVVLVVDSSGSVLAKLGYSYIES